LEDKYISFTKEKYQETFEMLKKNKNALDVLSKELVERETMSLDELQATLKQNKIELQFS
jgi:ATP-dependent Zn protease